MAYIIADRVLETSTTTGTGTYTLAGAVTGFQAASAVCANNDTVAYYAEEVDVSGVPSGGWETGLGTWATGGTLARTSIDSSSNAGAAVSWGAGTRRIGLGLTARRKDSLIRSAKTGAYTVVGADNGTVIDCTSNTFTVALTPAATLGPGFTCWIVNSGTGDITIDPNSTETIDGSSISHIIKRAGPAVRLLCDGTGFATIGIGYGGGFGANGRNIIFGSNITGIGVSCISIGHATRADGTKSVSMGDGCSATGNYETSLGLNSSAQSSVCTTGAGAMALGGSYASGVDSFAAAIGNNTSTYGAQGSGAIAMGGLSKATATNSMALLGAVITTTKRFGIGGAGFCQAVSEAANSAMGTTTLVGGAATVSNTLVSATSRIFLTSQVDGGTVGFLRVSARTAGTSFVITSSNPLDTSTVAYIFYEPQ